MTENERSLIKEFEERGWLPWEPGMVAEHQNIAFTVVEAGNNMRGEPSLYGVKSYRDDYSARQQDCTHAPCDALVGWLVGQLQAYGEGQPHHYLHINDYYGVHVRAGEVWGNGVKSVSVSGDTFLEALLRAFKAKWEAEHGA